MMDRTLRAHIAFLGIFFNNVLVFSTFEEGHQPTLRILVFHLQDLPHQKFKRCAFEEW